LKNGPQKPYNDPKQKKHVTDEAIYIRCRTSNPYLPTYDAALSDYHIVAYLQEKLSIYMKGRKTKPTQERKYLNQIINLGMISDHCLSPAAVNNR
jgi:hypothetical protein